MAEVRLTWMPTASHGCQRPSIGTAGCRKRPRRRCHSTVALHECASCHGCRRVPDASRGNLVGCGREHDVSEAERLGYRPTSAPRSASPQGSMASGRAARVRRPFAGLWLPRDLPPQLRAWSARGGSMTTTDFLSADNRSNIRAHGQRKSPYPSSPQRGALTACPGRPGGRCAAGDRAL